MSLADDIFEAAKVLKRKPIKAWGKDVWAWELMADERDEFEAGRIVQKGKKLVIDYKGSRAKLVVACLRVSGEDGALPVFMTDDLRRLRRVGGAELDRVYEECAKVSGIVAGDDEEEEGPRPFETRNCSSSG